MMGATPLRGVPISWVSPLARNLLVAYFPSRLDALPSGGKWFDSAKGLKTSNRYVTPDHGNAHVEACPSEVGGTCIDTQGLMYGDTIKTPAGVPELGGSLARGVTVCQWLWPKNEVIGSRATTWGLTNGGNNSGGRFFMDNATWDAAKFTFGSKPSGAAVNTVFSNVPHSQWHFCAASLTADGDLIMYLNGAVDSESSISAPSWGTSDGLSISTGYQWGDQDEFRGKLGPLLIWSRPLGVGELHQIYRDPYVMFRPTNWVRRVPWGTIPSVMPERRW